MNTVPVAGGQTSQAVVVTTSTQNYTFTIRAKNKAGWGAWSAPSAPRRAINPPGAPTGVSATEGNNTVGVTWTAGAANGAAAGEINYQYSVNGGGWRSDWIGGGSGGSGTIGNGQVNNNGSYTIRVQATVNVDGANYASGASNTSNQVAPYGPIGNPKANASASGTSISVSWSSPARNGRDITTQINVGNGWETVAASGSRNLGNVGYSTTRTINVRTSAAGQTTTDSASATTQDAPPPPEPRAWVSRGAVGAGGQLLRRQHRELQPPGNYTYKCIGDGSQFNSWEGPVYMPANGRVQLECYWGYPGKPVSVILNGKQYETTTGDPAASGRAT